MFEDNNEKSEEIVNHNFENNSSKFYKEHSHCDKGDIRERTQRWIEEKFKDSDSEQTHLLMEQKFDMIFNDCSFIQDSKNFSPTLEAESGAIPCNFSRDDLNDNTYTKSGENFSLNTDKGSENGGAKENLPADIGDMKISSFWKRVDMRQKKVIRGL